MQQIQIQLANPLPYDLDEVNLSEYRRLAPHWHDWRTVKAASVDCAALIFDRVTGIE